nr:hypothetical protein [uncultured Devosia sp.]
MDPWVPVFYESPGISTADWLTIGLSLVSVVIGALISALVSYHIQERANRHSEKREEQARKADQRGQLLNALFRAMYVHADVNSVVVGIAESHLRAKAAQLKSQNQWTRIAPIVGRGTAQPIIASELAPLVDAKEFDLIARYCELLMGHSALLQAQELYERDWLELSAMLPATRTSAGMLQTGLSADEERVFQPRFTRLNGLAVSLEESSATQLKLATAIVRDLGTAGQDLFGEGFPKYRVLPAAPDIAAPRTSSELGQTTSITPPA